MKTHNEDFSQYISDMAVKAFPKNAPQAQQKSQRNDIEDEIPF